MCDPITEKIVDTTAKYDPVSKKLEQDYGFRPKSIGQMMGINKQGTNRFHLEGGRGFQPEATRVSPGRHVSQSLAARRASGG